MGSIAEKFEAILEAGDKPKAYAIERRIMSDKISQMMVDMKICQENVNDYEKVVKALCLKNKNLQKENEKLSHENKKLSLKSMRLDHMNDELELVKTKNLMLMDKIDVLKSEIVGYFEKEAIEEEKEEKEIAILKFERENLKKIFEKTHEFENEANIDKIAKGPEMAKFMKEYGKLEIKILKRLWLGKIPKNTIRRLLSTLKI